MKERKRLLPGLNFPLLARLCPLLPDTFWSPATAMTETLAEPAEDAIQPSLFASMAGRRRQRLAAARLLAGTGASWRTIDACPAWATASEGERQRLAAFVGAWWLADSLRASIDGKRLAAVCDVLGEDGLQRLLRAESGGLELDAAPPRPGLTEASQCADQLQSCGRALLLWGLPAALRALMPTALGWPAPEVNQHHAFDAHIDWARRAIDTGTAEAARCVQPASPPEEGEEGEEEAGNDDDE